MSNKRALGVGKSSTLEGDVALGWYAEAVEYLEAK
jgi:hypothetical protein